MLIVKVGSPTTEFDLGSYLQATNYDTGQVTNQLVKVLCYPSGGGIKITLPPTDFANNSGGGVIPQNAPTQNLVVLVADASGDGGTNTITVEAGVGLVSGAHEKINGANTLALSKNYEAGNFEILTTGAWVGAKNDAP